MSTTLSISGSVANADALTRYDLVTFAPSLETNILVQYRQMAIGNTTIHTMDLNEMPDSGNGPQANAVFLFVQSGSVVVHLTTGPSPSDTASIYVDKMLILMDARVFSMTVTGTDADGSVYDLILGG